MDFVLDSADLSAYLECDDTVDWRDRTVRRKATEIHDASGGDEVARTAATFEWVRDAIAHTKDAGRDEVTCSASEVLAVGTGICYAKAHLLAALLRANGVPAGFCYQVYCEPLHCSAERMALHGLNGIYLRGLGRWVRVDCRGNNDAVNAQFSVDREQLAFPDLGFLDSKIYARPLPEVVCALQAWDSCALLWPHLPTPGRAAIASMRRVGDSQI